MKTAGGGHHGDHIGLKGSQAHSTETSSLAGLVSLAQTLRALGRGCGMLLALLVLEVLVPLLTNVPGDFTALPWRLGAASPLCGRVQHVSIRPDKHCDPFFKSCVKWHLASAPRAISPRGGGVSPLRHQISLYGCVRQPH